jgi:septal ring factor EnvC (AmiA/AmiB activator)
MIITLTGLIFGAAAADGTNAAGSSQTPAIVALMVGITSSIVAAYSMWRQVRGDSAQQKAAATSVATDANKQSFEQVMAMNTKLAERLAVVEKERDTAEAKVDDLEVQLADADDELGKSKRDNARLRRLVREHGGTP